tara:strand:+ start:2184 stop:3176 length:993 start_codon:yes stop_codon:yes gene_type:complete
MINFVFLILLLFNINTLSAADNQSTDNGLSKSAKDFNHWKKETKKYFKNQGFKEKTISYIDELVFKRKVIELDRKQPEFKLTFNEYIKKVISNDIILKGKSNLKKNKNLLKNIEQNFNIPKNLIVSLWGIETFYGKYTGGFDVLNSLATLSFDGRRSKFFYKEFEYALMIIEQEFLEREYLKGSWAGAIGQTQFMPSTFINYAIDFDENGKMDLLNDKGDALASGANYLKKIGWDINKNWGEQIYIDITENPNFIKFSNDKLFRDKSFWESYGIKFKKKYSKNEQLKLVIPDQVSKKYFLVTKNFDVILNWNRSNYFALAVNILSDKIYE